MKIEAYTDGSAKNNGFSNVMGGWAYAIIKDEVIHSDNGYMLESTNQQMELLAAIKACEYLDKNYGGFDSFTVYSDSAYLVNCANDKWYYKWLNNDWKNFTNGPVANKEYWIKLIPFFEDYRFSFIKVKGHSNNKYNNLVDGLAQSAAEEGREKFESSCD